jgi:preprotein translocase subunit YajC
MPIDPASLEAIRDPTGGRLTQLGQIFSQAQQQKKKSELAERQMSMEEDVFRLKKRGMVLDEKRDELTFSGDVALSLKAYYDQGGDVAGAEELYKTYQEDAQTLGYSLPETTPNKSQVEGLAAKSKQYIGYLNATKASDSTKKWQFIAQLAAVPESKRTDEQKRMLEELTRPDTVIKVPGPTGRIMQVGKNFMATAKVNDIELKGEIEGEKGYTDAVTTRAQAIQAESKSPVSLSDAMSQAHDELQHKLIPTDAFKIPGTDVSPFSKQFIYNPNASPSDQPPAEQTKGQLSEVKIKAVLESNKLEDTPENRKAINDAYDKL